MTTASGDALRNLKFLFHCCLKALTTRSDRTLIIYFPFSCALVAHDHHNVIEYNIVKMFPNRLCYNACAHLSGRLSYPVVKFTEVAKSFKKTCCLRTTSHHRNGRPTTRSMYSIQYSSKIISRFTLLQSSTGNVDCNCVTFHMVVLKMVGTAFKCRKAYGSYSVIGIAPIPSAS